MDYVVLIVASLMAGVATGLVGLSAATVMVPMLIVLTDTFSGANGFYEATTIALASDIIGSLVTTIIYARHKNIDLKNGYIVLLCVISMCAVGSYVAYLVGGTVLGGFSIVMSLVIGVRFLLDKGNNSFKLDLTKKWKVILSIIFGLCIGFGTGFVGTGGGMMMLLLFTVVLGYELKSAVGTSTLVMTFTALIASIAHIIIHPSILTNHLDFLLIGIVVATCASIISAIFANKTNERIVKKVIGVILTILGMLLIYLNYFA